MIAVRCSALPRLAACAASRVAPAIAVSDDAAEARLGSAAHEVLALLPAGRATPEAEVRAAERWRVSPDDVRLLLAFGRAFWAERGGLFPDPQTEAPLAWDDDANGIRLTGTADVLACPGEVRVADYKTGWGDDEHAQQLRGYCWLALQARPDLGRAYGCVVRLRERTLEGFAWSRQDLAAWWAGLAPRLAAAAETYSPSAAACTRCPRLHECPAATGLVGQAALPLQGAAAAGAEPAAIAAARAAAAPPGALERARHWIDLRERLKLIEKVSDRALDVMRAEVEALGGTMPDGA